jgi:glycosyltransferase involved in cell wall biosynthesis
MLRETLQAILEQDVPIGLDVVVVFDRSTPDHSLTELSTADRRVRVMTNTRTLGLAGNRNTGILALQTEWVAFCDDDDVWARGKLRAQPERARRHPAADVITTGIRVVYGGSESDRLAGLDEVHHRDLLRSRMAMLHSSTLLLRRSALLGRLGLVDEEIPGSQNED